MIGDRFCAACHRFELTGGPRPRCAACGSRKILTDGTLRAAVVRRKRGERKDALSEAVKTLLRWSGASWPGDGADQER